MARFTEQISTFSNWIDLRTATAFPDQWVVYLVRVADENGCGLKINRARSVDSTGIINIGSGFGSSRLPHIRDELGLTNKEDWKKRHQLMLWWVMCDFDSLEGFAARNLQLSWKLEKDKPAARKLEADLLWAYKLEFADIPIGNLKSW